MLQFIKKLFGGGADFKGLLQQGAIIVDVRTPGEFAAGHIKGSLNIPLDSIKPKLDSLKKKGKPVITVCRSGARSRIAVGILKQAGMEAYNGGAWISLKHKI